MLSIDCENRGGNQLPADRLVAHRGWPAQFPENTIAGFSAALDQGARWIECDVQLTADGVPILFHDESLIRSSRQSALVTQLPSDQLPAGGAAFPDKYGDKFASQPIDALESLLPLLDEHAHVRAFVELKPESAKSAGYEKLVATSLAVLRKLARRQSVAAVISKDVRLVQMVAIDDWPVGWVLPEWNQVNLQLAERIAPDYLFCDVRCLPSHASALWQANWQWIAYTVNRPSQIAEWLKFGMQMVETDDIGGAL